ncbi:MAG: hypothetical protein ACOVQ6_15345 [Brevundimonas sp.]
MIWPEALDLEKTSAPLTLPVCLFLMLAGVIENEAVSLVLIGAAAVLAASMAWSVLRDRMR